MRINAIIESKDGGTLVLDFPRSIYDVYEKLQSVGIRQSPHQITLSDNSYGRASIKLDGKELVVFSWIDMYKQEWDTNEYWKENGVYDSSAPELKDKWEREGTLSEWDFLHAATEFLQMPISSALISDNCLIRVFAIMDRRVGKRTIKQIQDSEIYKTYPEWAQQFYKLRFAC